MLKDKYIVYLYVLKHQLYL